MTFSGGSSPLGGDARGAWAIEIICVIDVYCRVGRVDERTKLESVLGSLTREMS